MKKNSIIILILSLCLMGCLAHIGVNEQGKINNKEKLKEPSSDFLNLKTPVMVKDWQTDRVVNTGVGVTESQKLKLQAISSHLKADLSLPTTATKILNPTAKFEWGKWVSAKSSPCLLVRDTTTLYFLTDNQVGYNVYALNLTSSNATLTLSGAIKWQRQLNGQFNGTSPTLVTGVKNRLYVVSNYYDSGTGKYGKLYCLDADTGYTLTEKSINDTIGFKDSSPWVNPVGANDYIYVASQNGHVYKFTYDINNNVFSLDYDKTISTSSKGRFSSSPVFRASTGMLYAGTEEGKLYEINAGNGDINFEWNLASGSTIGQNTGGRILSTLVIDDSNSIAIVTCGGYLFRIDINSKEVKQSPLLEFRQNMTSLPHEPVRPDKKGASSTFSSTLKSDAKPPTTKLDLESNSGLSVGDYIKIKSTPVYGYGGIAKVDDKSGSVDLNVVAGNGLWPTVGATPNPLKADVVESGSNVVRYNPAPVPGPPDTFALGSVANLSVSDYIRVYDTLNNTHVGKVDIINTTTKVVTLNLGLTPAYTPTGGEKWEKIYNEIQVANIGPPSFITVASVDGFYVGDIIRINGQYGYEYGTITDITGKTLTLTPQLTTTTGLPNKTVDVINANPYYGRIFTGNTLSLGDIKSSPVIMDTGLNILNDGTPNRAYVGNNNAIFELDYDTSVNFTNFANYCLTQAGRLDSSGLNLQQAHQASSPKIATNLSTNTKMLFIIDEDITKTTGTFINRFNVPIADATGLITDRLNTFFPISEVSSTGLPVYSNNFPLIATNTMTIENGVKGYWVFFGAGNGTIYGLDLQKAWN